MKDDIEEFKDQYSLFIRNVVEFNNKDNYQAGKRARKSLIIMYKLSRKLRKQIQERVNDLKYRPPHADV